MEALKRFPEFVNWTTIKAAFNFEDPLVYVVFAHVIFNPLYWNIVARLEYNTRFLSKGVFGSKKPGDKRSLIACAVNGVFIFVIGLTRDYLYNYVIEKQPPFMPLEEMFKEEWHYTGLVINIFAAILLACGGILVLGAYYQLGLRGTYLGDYFGFYLPGEIHSFPFNVSTCPMYDGSSLNFLAFAIYNRSLLGVLVTILVFTCYHVACIFEDSFTREIYRKKAEEDAKKSK